MLGAALGPAQSPEGTTASAALELALEPASAMLPEDMPAPATTGTAVRAVAPEAGRPSAAPLPPIEPEPNHEGLRFNFRGVSLDSVLDYMGKAGGFVINREADVQGSVDVVSHQPLNKEEAVTLLDTLLNQNGLAAVRNDKTLTIVRREEARTRNLPIRVGSDPTSIPQTQEMVTQIMPVRHANASELMQNIDPLLLEYATVSANESSNVIILTSTQANIHSIAQIIQALDTSISGVSRVRVFTVRRADAQELATIINSLFSGTGTARNEEDRREQMRRFFEGMRGRGGPGGRFGR
jgi:general secretion pathway protein D